MITQAAAIKLILQHIGGSKIKGTQSVIAEGKKIVTKAQSAKIADIADTIKQLGETVNDIRQALVSNPKGKQLTSAAAAITSVAADVATAPSVPSEIKLQVANALAALQTSVNDFKTHTDILSGVRDVNFDDDTLETLVDQLSNDVANNVSAVNALAASAAFSAAAAQTFSASASTSAGQANVFAYTANAAAALAQTAATTALDARDVAGNWANVANSFAQVANVAAIGASASANLASNSASAAASSANAAYNSEIAAGSSANSSAQYAAAAQATALRAQVAGASLLPHDFLANGTFWSDTITGDPEIVSEPVGATYVNVADVGRTIRLPTQSDFRTRGLITPIPNHTYQMTARVRMLVDSSPTKGIVVAKFYSLDETFASPAPLSFSNVAGFAQTDQIVSAADGWVTIASRVTVPSSPDYQYLAPTVILGSGASSNTGSGEVVFVKVEDLTSPIAAAGNAAAAVISFQAAEAAANQAGLFATAAQGYSLTANTKANDASGFAGQAQTYSIQAANSATNASGSAASAATSAGLAAGSATAAGNHAGAAASNAASAQSFANDAASYAGAAASSSLTANASYFATQDVAGRTYPRTFVESGKWWSYQLAADGSGPIISTATGVAIDSVGGKALVLRATTPTANIYPRYSVPFATGRTTRITVVAKARSTTGSLVIATESANDNPSSLGIYTLLSNTSINTTWLTYTAEFNHDTTFISGTTRYYPKVSVSNADVEYVAIEDVTLNKEAANSASAAVTAASSAQAFANSSSQSAGAAATSATNANTFAASAQTFSIEASLSASNASGSAASAASASGVAVAARDASIAAKDLSEAAATAAAGSASSANVSANSAGQSAAAALTSATNANTFAASAQTFSIQSSQSASNASSSAASANTASGIAVSASTSAKLTAASLLPSDFAQDGLFWVGGSFQGSPSSRTSIVANSTYSFSSDSSGRFIRVFTGTNNFIDTSALDAVLILPNRRYKLTARGRYAEGTGSGTKYLILFSIGLNSSHTYVAAASTQTNLVVTDTSINTISHEIIGNTFIGNGGVYLRPLLRAQDSGNSNNFDWFSCKLEDITESYNAGVSASAAATSASSASASQSAAGSSAAAAASSATQASTSAGQALTYRNEASTSATDAASSATSASSSAGVAATSATNAANSATNAANSATNASNSASAASGSANTASTQATNAANSATAAASSATSAGTSATNAANSASAASTSASNASTSATQASTSATNAAGSASSALSSATTASNSVRDTVPQSMNREAFTNNITGLNSAILHASSWNEASRLAVLDTTQSALYYPYGIWCRGTIPWVANRRYEVKVTVNLATGAVSNYVWGYIILLNGSGTAVTQSFGGLSGSTGLIPTGSNWATYTATVNSNDLSGATSAHYIKFGVLVNRNTSADVVAGTVQVSSLYWRDITESYNAAGSASAAATSASSASTSATNAGNSATSATTASNNAQTYSNNAASSATAAATSAAASSASAASALSSQILSASINTGYLHPNPMFANWSNASSVPDNWNRDTSLGSGSSLTRVTGQYGFGYAAQLAGGAGASAYFSIANVTAPILQTFGWYMLETDVVLDSGSFSGAAIYLNAYASNGTTYQVYSYPLSTTPDITGVAPGSGSTGRMYRFRIPVRITLADAKFFALYVMSHFSGVGSISSANQITWYRAGIRPASDAEVAGHLALAEVKVLGAAVAELNGRSSALWSVGASIPGSDADASISVAARSNNPAAAPMTFFGSNLYNVTKVEGRRIRKLSNSGAWGAGIFTRETYASGAYISYRKAFSDTQYIMVGLSDASVVETTGTYDFSSIDYAIYHVGQFVYIYESGVSLGIEFFDDATENDLWEIHYNNSNVLYKRNGVVFNTTSAGAGRTFRFMADLHTTPATIDHVVFGVAPPSTSSSVAIVAEEIALFNKVSSANKLAMKIKNGNALFSGDLNVGGRIILGNGTGLQIQYRPFSFQVADGNAVSWTNLGYIPNFNFNPLGLAPLAATETYSLYLDNISASGATARLKINVPGTPGNYNLTTDSAGSGSDPARVIDKASNPDARGGSYTFTGAYTSTVTAYFDLDSSTYFAYHVIDIDLWVKISGTWTKIGTYYTPITAFPGAGGEQPYNGTFTVTLTAGSGVTHFGMGAGTIGGTPLTNLDLQSVAWQSPGTASGIRTASPNGEKCNLTILP